MDRHMNMSFDGRSFFRTVKVDQDGIRLFGLLYDGPELARLRRDARSVGWNVTAVMDPANWQQALAIMPDTFELVRLPLVSKDRGSNYLSKATPEPVRLPALRRSVAATVLAKCHHIVALPRGWGRGR